MTERLTAEWGERIRDRIRACSEVCLLDIIWETAVSQHRGEGPVYPLVRWWVHRRMRDLVRQSQSTMPAANRMLDSFTARPIDDWPDEWWRPIPEAERAAMRERRQPKTGLETRLTRGQP
jgi:hypothetical protein